ncbi:hypothetical protein [Dyella caseinilytica]|uniref:Uncharacterized protein n=1 Tax=Dyella caseinilytica TaxID=1849581 RepID=A0ABX7GYY9_9GAMM|nr:hypothetical protein [Dyella caseinilytica]QRN55671.1 hypothetical protein ISN74_10295 [Dyella caseinilytica]GGA03576.1 hypothetical protein GCM10011408_26400 [Dyella caseinilytica]
MYTRIKHTLTVYPCRHRSQQSSLATETEVGVWMTWEGIEREHFSPKGSLMADFSQPLEVDPALVRNHCYSPESVS